MSRCTFYLLSINGSASDFKASLSTIPNKPLYVGKVHRWVVPLKIYSLGPQGQAPWDVFLFFSGSIELPEQTKALLKAEWRLEAEAPSPMLDAVPTTNQRLSHLKPEDIPPLTGGWEHVPKVDLDRHQEMAYSPELQEWVRSFGAQEGKNAVSMFNLLSYHEGKREVFMQYVAAFGATLGKAVGSEALIIGGVKRCSSTPYGEKQWEDAALVHYPSIYHFAELVASDEYQKLDAEYKVGTIKDTGILCLTELE